MTSATRSSTPAGDCADEPRNLELEALYQAEVHLHRHLHLDQVLQSLVDVVVDLLGADKAGVQVFDPGSGTLKMRAWRGFSAETVATMSGYGPGDGITGKVFASGEIIAVEDAASAPPPANQLSLAEGVASFMSVPIKIDGQIFGVFGMNYAAPRRFSADDRRLFQTLAQRAATALENARLYEQAQQAAVLQERQRLARELHDSVTQSLYSLMLLAEAGRRFAAAGETRHLEGHLQRLGEVAQQALKEMRLMVYEMRPLELEQAGLAQALQQRLDSVERRAGIQARLDVNGLVRLEAGAEEAVYRIAQEALNNALKHSGAAAVTVRLAATQAALELEITDDGTGFDPAAAPPGGMGLNSMSERARRIGGGIAVLSRPGEGTRVRLSVPMNQNLEGIP